MTWAGLSGGCLAGRLMDSEPGPPPDEAKEVHPRPPLPASSAPTSGMDSDAKHKGTEHDDMADIPHTNMPPAAAKTKKQQANLKSLMQVRAPPAPK